MPTSAERLVWAQGNGSTLNVYDTPFGKLCGLLCWENFMPLARTALYARPDVFKFAVNRSSNPMVNLVEDTPEIKGDPSL